MSASWSAGSEPHWRRQALRDFWRLGWLKAAGSSLYIAIFLHYYFVLVRDPAHPLLVVPLTPFDLWLPFQPWAFWPYASEWVYICLPAALLPDFSRLMRHGAAAAVLCAVGIAAYAWVPSSFVLAKPLWPAGHVGAFLGQMDATRNVFPSMHVAFASFACVWLGFILRSLGAPGWLRAVNIAWCALIVYSTLAIKQHVLWDAAAGFVLGLPWGWASARWAMPRLAFRARGRRSRR